MKGGNYEKAKSNGGIDLSHSGSAPKGAIIGRDHFYHLVDHTSTACLENFSFQSSSLPFLPVYQVLNNSFDPKTSISEALLVDVRLHPSSFINRLNESHTPWPLTRELTLHSTLNSPLVLCSINANILSSGLGEQLLPVISSEEKGVEEDEDEILSVSPLASIKEVEFEKGGSRYGVASGKYQKVVGGRRGVYCWM